MIQQVFFHLFGILSSISSSPFDTEILSELLSQSVVSVYSWNTLLLFHLAVLIHLGQVTFCREVLLLICFSGLGPISLVLAQWCHTKHLLHLQMQTMKSSHQNRRNLCCHLGCRHQWAALMRLPLSHSTWLIVIIGLCVHCIRPSGTISAPLPCGTDVLQLR